MKTVAVVREVVGSKGSGGRGERERGGGGGAPVREVFPRISRTFDDHMIMLVPAKLNTKIEIQF